MKCRDCGLELRIQSVDITFENDDTSEVETKAYVNQKLVCVNKNCQSNGKVQKINRILLN